jgi:hypothetical protein
MTDQLNTRCTGRLTAPVSFAVDMTSGVKGYFVSKSVDGLFSLFSSDLSPDHWKRRSQSSRRLITLLSVGWVPPDWRPSGACLALGPRVSCRR